MSPNKSKKVERQKKTKDRATEADNTDKKNKDKKNTSLRLDKKTLKALKIMAIEKETSVQKLIETLIHDYIGEHQA